MKIEDVKVGMKVRVIASVEQLHKIRITHGLARDIACSIQTVSSISRNESQCPVCVETGWHFPCEFIEPYEEPTPRPHAELAALYYSDSRMKCWGWDGVMWRNIDAPLWSSVSIYHVGLEIPTEPPEQFRKPTIYTINGIEFPMPLSAKPKHYESYYYVDSCITVARGNFTNHPTDAMRFAAGNCYATEIQAQQAVGAHRKLHAQAIEEAMKGK